MLYTKGYIEVGSTGVLCSELVAFTALMFKVSTEIAITAAILHSVVMVLHTAQCVK